MLKPEPEGLHSHAGLGPVLGPRLSVGRVAGEGHLAHRGAVGSVGAVLQPDGHVRDLVAGLRAEHAGRALDAVVGVLRVLDLDDCVLDVGQVLSGGTRDVAFLILSLSLTLERRAGGSAHGIGHDVEALRGDLLVEAGGNRGGRGSREARRRGGERLRDVDLRLRAHAVL